MYYWIYPRDTPKTLYIILGSSSISIVENPPGRPDCRWPPEVPNLRGFSHLQELSVRAGAWMAGGRLLAGDGASKQ